MAEQDTVNPQIVDAVEGTNRVVDEAARQAATAIAFQEIVQSMTVAVQSSVDHLLSTFSLNVATTGSVLAQALDDRDSLSELRSLLETSQAAVSAAIANLAQLVAETAKALHELSPEQAVTSSRGRAGAAAREPKEKS